MTRSRPTTRPSRPGCRGCSTRTTARRSSSKEADVVQQFIASATGGDERILAEHRTAAITVHVSAYDLIAESGVQEWDRAEESAVNGALHSAGPMAAHDGAVDDQVADVQESFARRRGHALSSYAAQIKDEVIKAPAVGDTVLIAHNPLSNDGREEAVLRDVRLIDAINLEVGAFDVLAHDKDGFRGVGPLEPLSEESPVIAVDEEAMVRVAVTLVDPSAPGEAEAFDVEYSDADGRGSASVRTTVTMEVLPAGQFCPEF